MRRGLGSGQDVESRRGEAWLVRVGMFFAMGICRAFEGS